MATRIMNRLLGAVALGLAMAASNIAADASIRLPAEEMTGIPSLAPLLSQIKAAVVTVSITGRAGREKNSRQGSGTRGQHTRSSHCSSDKGDRLRCGHRC